MNVTSQYTWSSSNTNVVSIVKIDPTCDSPDYFKVYVSDKGTAVITGTPVNPANRTMKMTITVEGSKMTKAQKNCKKHAWKTTKKPTCERTGIKTCTKCKLQKSMPKTSHKYETNMATEQVDDEVYWLLTCTSTSCGNDLTCTERPSPDSVCVHFCGFRGSMPEITGTTRIVQSTQCLHTGRMTANVPAKSQKIHSEVVHTMTQRCISDTGRLHRKTVQILRKRESRNKESHQKCMTK